MRDLTFLLLAIFFLAFAGYAQAVQDDVRELYRRSSELYQQGRFDDAIPLIERIVSIEKRSSKGSLAHAVALANLAEIHRTKARTLRTSLAKITAADRMRALVTANDSAEKAKKYLEEALEIHKKIDQQLSVEAAAAKTQLAWLKYNFYSSDSTRESRENIDAAERLYLEALAAEEKLTPADLDNRLRTLADFAEFYMNYANFEKALPLYETYIQLAEVLYPADARRVTGLRGLARVYQIIDRADEAGRVFQRIEKITGKPEKRELELPLLHARAREILTPGGNFFARNFRDLDTSFRQKREIDSMVNRPGTYKTHSIEVELLVSETGEVADAKVLTHTKYDAEVEKAARSSRFRPFAPGGDARRLRGKITFTFREF